MNNLFSYLSSKARLDTLGILNMPKRSVVLLAFLGVAASSCDTLGSGGDSRSGES